MCGSPLKTNPISDSQRSKNMSTISNVEDFDGDGAPAPEPVEKPEEEEKLEEEPKGEDPKEEPKEDPILEPEEEEDDEKFYAFNGQQLSGDELYQEARLLQAEYTRRTQSDKPKEEEEFTPEQVDAFKKIAKKVGMVSVEELESRQAKSTQESILADFNKEHPEYTNPKKSKALFKALAGYNTDTQYLAKSLLRAHEEIGTGTSAHKIVKAAPAGSGGGSPSNSEHTPEQIEVMKKMGVYDD